MDPDRQFSLRLSQALDCLGKGQDMIKYRVDHYKQLERDAIIIHKYTEEEPIIAGSKGEGLTAPFESDYDCMFVFSHVICIDDTSSFNHVPNFTVFETERQYTSPGYTKLRQPCSEIIDFCFLPTLIKERNEHLYVSSDLIIQQYANYLISLDSRVIRLDRCGPSLPFSSKLFNISQDFVIALPCICPQITQSFIKRHREYGWPSNDQLIEISSLECHVVPVGFKGSDAAFLEWRICYTEAERFLMRSLNDTQTKVYILLKMVTKTFINSTSKEITSYVLKNVVLWLVEYNDLTVFKDELLVDRFIQALDFLRICINNNNLPSYMISERNLFSMKLDVEQRKKMTFLLSELIHEGGRLFMGCEILRGTLIVLYKEPAIAEQYRCKRDMIEKLYLLKSYKWLGVSHEPREQQVPLLLTDDINVKMAIINLFLIQPDFLSLILQGHSPSSTLFIFKERLKQWLS